MTAVEELLQRAADVRRLFDEMLGPLPDGRHVGRAADVANSLARYCDPKRFLAELADPAGDGEGSIFSPQAFLDLVEPFYRHLITPDRWRLLGRWGSADAMFIAAARSVVEKGDHRKDVRALDRYLGFLEQRERLLDPESLESLAGGAVRESIAWGPDAPEARQRAEAVAESLRRLAQRDVNTRERWQEERDSRLEQAVVRLGRFARQPAIAAKVQTAPLRKGKKRSASGGRPQTHNGDLLRERRRYEAKMKRTKGKTQPLGPWLTEWARRHGQDVDGIRRRYNSEVTRAARDKRRRQTAD